MLLRGLLMNYLREQAQARLYEAARQSLAEGQSQPERPADMPPCEVALVFAMSIEAGGLVDLLSETVTTRCANFVEHVGLLNGRRVVVIEAGVGPVAEAATADAITLHQVKWVISAGFATALKGDLRRGHFLIAEEVVDTHGHHLHVDLHVQRESLSLNRSLHVGRLITIDHSLHSAEEKHRLGDNHAAVACDMESLGIGKICHERNVRFLAVRVITEAVDDELPKEVERMRDQKSLAAKLGAAAGAVWNRPSTLKDILHLKEEALKASDRLAKFLAGVVGNLPQSS